MNCKACGKFHWGCCLDKTIPISKRMKAGQVVDGDRSSDAPWWREPVNANEFAGEVKALESLLAALVTAAEPIIAWPHGGEPKLPTSLATLAAAVEKAREGSAVASAEVAIAETIARIAHHGQKTYSEGMSYIEHPAAVAASVPGEFKAAAWLHDVLEDCPTFTEAHLLAAGIQPATVAAVRIVSRDKDGETYTQFINRIVASGNLAAITVKLADLRHNLRPSCPERLAVRYRAALPRLEEAVQKAREAQAQ